MGIWYDENQSPIHPLLPERDSTARKKNPEFPARSIVRIQVLPVVHGGLAGLPGAARELKSRFLLNKVDMDPQ